MRVTRDRMCLERQLPCLKTVDVLCDPARYLGTVPNHLCTPVTQADRPYGSALGPQAVMRSGSTTFVIAGAIGCALFVITTLGLTDENENLQRRHLLSTWDAQHPGPDTPFAWTGRNIAAIAAACVCALLANSAGVGGGPFYVPLLNVVVGFSLKDCTGLSHTIVATSAVASTLYGLAHPRPGHPDRPLVDLDVALVFIPALLFGVSLGVICNNIVPEWLRVVLLTALLLFVVYKTANKGRRQYLEEEKSRKKVSAEHAPFVDDDNSDAASTKDGVLHEESFHPTRETPAGDGVHDVEAPVVSEDQGLLSTLQVVNWWQVVQLLALWAVFLAFQMGKSKYGTCTKEYLLLFAAQTIFCISVTVFFIRRELAEVMEDADHADPEMHELLLGTRAGVAAGERKPIKVLLTAVGILAVSGATAGLLGIGGALIFNPYLLQLGMDPRVVASTSVLMILFSSSTISLSYFFNGTLNTHYALVFAPICFVASLVGVTVVGRIVKKTGRSSILIFILTFLIAVGTLLSAVFGGRKAFDDIKHHRNIGFQPFCRS